MFTKLPPFRYREPRCNFSSEENYYSSRHRKVDVLIEKAAKNFLKSSNNGENDGTKDIKTTEVLLVKCAVCGLNSTHYKGQIEEEYRDTFRSEAFGNRKPVSRIIEATLMQTEKHKEFQVEDSSKKETKRKLWDAKLMVPDKDTEL